MTPDDLQPTPADPNELSEEQLIQAIYVATEYLNELLMRARKYHLQATITVDDTRILDRYRPSHTTLLVSLGRVSKHSLGA